MGHSDCCWLFQHSLIMKIVFTNLFCLLLIYASGCSKVPEGPTPPENVTIPDKQLLMNISRQAIARQLPDISFTNLELRDISYSWSSGDLIQYTNEQFSVDFRVKNSKRKTVKVSSELMESGSTSRLTDRLPVVVSPKLLRHTAQIMRACLASFPAKGDRSGENRFIQLNLIRLFRVPIDLI